MVKIKECNKIYIMILANSAVHIYFFWTKGKFMKFIILQTSRFVACGWGPPGKEEKRRPQLKE